MRIEFAILLKFGTLYYCIASFLSEQQILVANRVNKFRANSRWKPLIAEFRKGFVELCLISSKSSDLENLLLKFAVCFVLSYASF